MKHLLFAICFLAMAIVTSCSNETPFSCSLVETDVEKVGTTEVTLTATINASNFDAIEQVGFMVSRSGGEKYDWYSAEKGRVITLTIKELKPSTPYTYNVFVRAEGDSWTFKGTEFKTLGNESPNPDPKTGNSQQAEQRTKE